MASLELYLIRHGIAAEPETGQSDNARPLTPEGIARLREQAAGLDALDACFDVVLTSPLLRARQTADVLVDNMSNRAPVIVAEALAPAGSSQSVVTELGRHGSRSRIALVGHEPGIGDLAAHLLGGHAPIGFKKGAICRIDFSRPPPGGKGSLRWFATPRMLRLAGGGSR